MGTVRRLWLGKWPPPRPFLAAAADLTAATALTVAAARRKMGERRMEAGAGVGVATRPEAGLATPTGRSPTPPACLPLPPP